MSLTLAKQYLDFTLVYVSSVRKCPFSLRIVALPFQKLSDAALDWLAIRSGVSPFLCLLQRWVSWALESSRRWCPQSRTLGGAAAALIRRQIHPPGPPTRPQKTKEAKIWLHLGLFSAKLRIGFMKTFLLYLLWIDLLGEAMSKWHLSIHIPWINVDKNSTILNE